MAIDTPPAFLIDPATKPTDRVPNGVEVIPKPGDAGGFTFFLSASADRFPAWGTRVIKRDQELRDFWPTESTLASAICSQVGRYASFPFTLDGPDRMTKIYESIFAFCENGEGFISMMTKVCFDLYTQDNGAFIELIRTANDPKAPVISMRHKDASRCRRTGNPDYPIIYWDIDEKAHLMPWYTIICLSEMPSPIEKYRGLQYCVLTRILRAAQVMQSIQQYMQEQVGGLKMHEIHLVGGFNQDLLDSTYASKMSAAAAQGRSVYVDPMILAALSPEGKVTHETITINKLPEGFNLDMFMKWYIEVIALGWEDEYQSFGPLPGGNLGTAQQSQTMADKARSKGPAMFMRVIEQKFNFHGVLTKTVKMKYGEQDPIADEQKIMLFWRFSQILNILVEKGLVTKEVGQLMLRDAGWLKKEYLTLLGHDDPTPQVRNTDMPVAGN